MQVQELIMRLKDRELPPDLLVNLSGILHRLTLSRNESKFFEDMFAKILQDVLSQHAWHAGIKINALAHFSNCSAGKFREILLKYQSIGYKILKTIANKNPDFLCIFCPSGIGDTIVVAGLSYEIQKLLNKSQTCLVVKQSQSKLGKMFENVTKLISLSSDEIQAVEFFMVTSERYFAENWIHGHFGHSLRDGSYEVDDNLTIVENYKLRFNLPISTTLGAFRIAPPKMKSCFQNPAQSIILFPVANTIKIPECDIEFWKSLANKLQSQGFEVYTNLAPNENPIEGTIPLQLDLQELYFVAEQAQFCIGIRSGIFDLLAQSKARIISISPTQSFLLSDLNRNFPRKNLWDIYFGQTESKLDSYQIEYFTTTEEVEQKILSIVQKFKE